jgi:hypothetical protein
MTVLYTFIFAIWIEAGAGLLRHPLGLDIYIHPSGSFSLLLSKMSNPDLKSVADPEEVA